MIKQDDNLSQRLIMILVTIYKIYQIQKYTEEQQYNSRHDTNIGWRDQMPQKIASVKARPQKLRASASHCPATFNTTT